MKTTLYYFSASGNSLKLAHDIANGHPTFAHDCELCHACIQWCPQFAVRHPGFDTNPRQYRNPAVRLADMLRA